MTTYQASVKLKEAVLAILGRYFDALESRQAAAIFPDPSYRWRFYEGQMSLDRMRAGILLLDRYVNESSQRNWAQTNHGGPRGITFDTGPELSRLPDAALIAMFQQLDAVLADIRDEDPNEFS